MNNPVEVLSKKRSKFSQAIRAANSQGRLGLVVYVVPGYPDIQSYSEIRQMLEDSDYVSIIETTVPVEGNFCTASDIIIKSHQMASAILKESFTVDILKTQKPNILVLYRQSVENQGLEHFLQEYPHIWDGCIPEWLDYDEPDYANTFAKHDIEYIVSVAPFMTEAEINLALNFALDDGMIYLSCAYKTGAEMYAISEIARCAQMVKKIRPQLTIAAGMGIKTASDISKISAIPDIDAVIVGTSLLQAIGEGKAARVSFLNEIEGSLHRSNNS